VCILEHFGEVETAVSVHVCYIQAIGRGNKWKVRTNNDKMHYQTIIEMNFACRPIAEFENKTGISHS